jgi:hypothetical protein
MFADTANPQFYKQFAQSGISRTQTAGLAKELKDSGIDLKNGAVDLAKAVKDNPGAAVNAVWSAVKGLPEGVVNSFKETGTAIGEGAAVALNKDISDKLNAIYGTDVSGAQQAMLAVRITLAVTGAAGAAKAATGAGDATVAAISKKLDEIKAEKEAAAAAAKAKIENNVNVDNPSLASAAQREFKPGTTHRAENVNTGQATDRDGLARVNEPAGNQPKSANDAQVAAANDGKTPPRWSTAYPAWQEGSTVTDRVATKPEVVRMVIDEKQYTDMLDAVKDGKNPAQNLGGWATKDPINSMSDVRNNMAITTEFKPNVTSAGAPKKLYVIEVEVQPGAGLREGTVGSMYDYGTKTVLPGGGHQVNFADKSPFTNPELYKARLSGVKEIK